MVYCLLSADSPAIQIFNSHYSVLSKSLSDPVSVAILLHKEGVVPRQILSRVECLSFSNKREVLLNALKEAVQANHGFLLTFANVLCKFSGNVQLGRAIRKDYGD